ncbi:hypothetical protein OIDMADRAFT_175530 [Oidiodendron maius Zn]|uniref:Transcription factor domain-containing protein n=1 Tax=Oidiodendron maius (strain Zn) TaxID=913774 RepID=A0A0C3I151_OIDMZ|nr:hypothetical protein OIDMADRAFT_175530 [Oidiodendron maius Zn]
MAASKPSELPFLTTTGAEKPNPKLRKFIRSHVMLGKNRGKTLPPRKKIQKDVQSRSASISEASSASQPGSEDTSTSPATASQPIFPIAVPPKFGSDASTIGIIDTVEPEAIEIVLRFSSIAKQILFCLESCILFERRAEEWIAPMAVDSAYLHSRIFSSQYFFDAILPRKPSTSSALTSSHYLKTIRLLRDRLEHDSDQVRLSNTTAAAVLSLACHAHIAGDSKSARHHLDGLRRIVNLRGGIATFRENSKLCDIGMVLHSGSKPAFFNNSSRAGNFPPYPNLTPFLELRGHSAADKYHTPAIYLDGIDKELAQTWRVISEFCAVINFAVQSEQRISTETFLDTMASVIYRLLDMRFDANSKNEAIRLSLLAFSSSIFLHWKRFGMSYPHLVSVYKDCLARMTLSEIPPQLLLWILVVGAISILDAANIEWLNPVLLTNIDICEIESWNTMQDLLKSFIWIGLIHDKPGKEVFDTALSYRRNSPP